MVIRASKLVMVNTTMTDVLKGHKTDGRLNPNERVHLEEMVDSNIPPRQMYTNLKKRNRTTSTTIKHVYNNASYRYRRSIGVRGMTCNIS